MATIPLRGLWFFLCSRSEQLIILEFVAQGFQVREFVAVALGDGVVQGFFAGPFNDRFHLVECGDEPLSFVKVEHLRKVCLRGVYFGVSHFQVSWYPVTLDRGSIVFVCADAVKSFLVGKRNYFVVVSLSTVGYSTAPFLQARFSDRIRIHGVARHGAPFNLLSPVRAGLNCVCGCSFH